MRENTNRAIAINSVIMYARMAINTVLALFTTRFALQALGVVDYGLFSVLGGIISFMGVFNTIMLSTCNRFMAVSIGKGDSHNINKTFNINFIIFIGCALVLLVLAVTIGDWYVRNKINYEGPRDNVLLVYYFSVLGSIISTLGIPYNGLLMAKERFFLFSLVDVALHIVRFGVVLGLVFCFKEKLLIYTILQATTISLPPVIYGIYCKRKFPEITEFHLVKNKTDYLEVFGFSGWVAFGAIACVIRNQAAALLVNFFFNTVMNTALGIANSLNLYVTLFANSLTQPMQPQITKSYAAQNYDRTESILVMSTKLSFLLMFFIGVPFFVDAEWIISLWLGQVPQYAVSFTILLIIDNIVMSFNSGLSLVLFADGRIALYQIVINVLRLLAVVAGYVVLKSGLPPESLFIAYILFSILIVISTQWCLKKTLNYNIKGLITKSYIPSLLTLACTFPIVLLPHSITPPARITVSVVYYCVILVFVGLSRREREYTFNRIHSLTTKIK